MNSTKKLVLAALLTSLTAIATLTLKIPTPPLGYIHLGDFFVLASGIILGPIAGALAAGIGSMFADFFSGYVIYAPFTFFIKAIAALTINLIFTSKQKSKSNINLLVASTISETLIVMGYFLFDTLLIFFNSANYSYKSLMLSLSSATLSIPYNLIQAFFAILISILIMPKLLKIFNRFFYML